MSVAVLGGGAVGLLTAHALAQAGCDVALLERAAVPREASWAGGGILGPLDPREVRPELVPLLRQAADAYAVLGAELRSQTGVDCEWRRTGGLLLETPLDEDAQALLLRLGLPAVRLSAAELQARQPGLTATAGFWLPALSQVRNPRLLKALYKRLPQMGVRLHRGAAAQITIDAQGRARLHGDGSDLHADVVVLAAGAWTPALLPEPLARPPIHPAKGEMLLLKSEPGALRHMLISPAAYLIPRADGHVLLGSTVTFAGFDKTPTPAAKAQLRAAAAELLPDTAQWPQLDHWAGLRPATPDGLPFIGRHPAAANLYVNAGHFRLGLSLAPAAAALITDLILERTPRFAAAPFALERMRAPDCGMGAFGLEPKADAL